MKYCSRTEAALAIVDVGRRLCENHYVVASDGNISCRIGKDRVLTTPTGVSKGRLDAAMLVETDLDGNPIGGKPSSELRMHLGVYKANPALNAVVHAHPLVATCFAAAGIALDEPILTEALMAIGSIPVAHFAVPGTEAVSESVAPFCTVYNGALLANHGAITWAEDLETAFFRMEWVEVIARATLVTKYVMGRYNRLSCLEVAPFAEIRERLGVTLGGQPMCAPKSGNVSDVLPRSGMVEHDDEDPRAHAMVASIIKHLKRQDDLEREELEAALVERIADRVVERIADDLQRHLSGMSSSGID